MKSLTEPRTPPAAGLSEPWIDWGKAIASQLIVWHHLAHYGPLAPRVAAAWPDLMDWTREAAAEPDEIAELEIDY